MPFTMEVVWALALPVRGKLETMRIVSSALSEYIGIISIPVRINRSVLLEIFMDKLIDFIACYTENS